jgi:cytochrome bd-type quinol oxidase subunit 2
MFSQKENKSFQGQFTMKVLLEVALMLFVYSQVYPTLVEPAISTMIGNSDSATGTLLSLIPFAIAAMIIIGVIGGNMITGRRY